VHGSRGDGAHARQGGSRGGWRPQHVAVSRAGNNGLCAPATSLRSLLQGSRTALRQLHERVSLTRAPRVTKTKDGRAPLHLAAYQGHLEVVKAMLQNSANVKATTGVRAASVGCCA
jgi:hypothetical protein